MGFENAIQWDMFMGYTQPGKLTVCELEHGP